MAGVLVGRIPNIETQGGPGSFEGGAGAQLFVECAARQYLGGELRALLGLEVDFGTPGF